jgi:hypothetical protein
MGSYDPSDEGQIVDQRCDVETMTTPWEKSYLECVTIGIKGNGIIPPLTTETLYHFYPYDTSLDVGVVIMSFQWE